MSNFTYIDLFAGAGGLSEGFVRSDFIPIAHVELDEAACFTLKTRTAYHHLKTVNGLEKYISYLKGEISRKDLYQSIPENLLMSVINLPISTESNPAIQSVIKERLNGKNVDLIIGGPPCQAYSLVGRARSANNMAGDPRNYLYVQYAEYLEKFNPKMFVFENVLGLKSAKNGVWLNNMAKLFTKKGYKMNLFTLEANNFRVMQKRKRIIIIGCREDLSLAVPDFESIKYSTLYKISDLFGDLPPIQAGEGRNRYSNYTSMTNELLSESLIRNDFDVLTQHTARPHTDQDKEIYRIVVEKWNQGKSRLNYNDLPDNLKTHKNRHSFFDRFKVVAGDQQYAQTVVAHIAKDGHYYIHPDIKQNRSITVREAARLQSFPDNYYFEGLKEDMNRTAAFKQIGNAVPPLMAQVIAEKLRCLLQDSSND